ncbi:hypothetical protein [Staphylococcus pseudintermedius]|uniref:hypothetical protein n=1 Tax=Staphylococcus pseudintermedius TaxID=283734 RepID=UPI0010220248|nr:hypothetical protein [Staphylococcus pseudintermedius]MBJ8322680.1 hypothetical protein [Staphylococcus pseudintermedius]RYS18675.1 hypothetical protein DLS48_11360 [Staphylococcus pseudintermedius]
MAKKDDLLLDSIKNASDIEIPFVIVFTYLDEYVETFKREDKAWRDFEKNTKQIIRKQIIIILKILILILMTMKSLIKTNLLQWLRKNL